MTYEPAEAIRRSALAQVSIVVTLIVGALLTGCASTERAGAATPPSTSRSTLATTTSSAARATSTSSSTSTSTSTSTVTPTTSTTTSTLTVTPTTEAAPASTAPSAPVSAQLARRIPEVPGFTLTDPPAGDVLFRYYDVPAGLQQHHQVIVSEDGVELGRVVVASGDPAGVPPIELYVEDVFAEETQLPRQVLPIDDGVAVMTTGADPVWIGLDGAAVIFAALPEDGVARWAWTSDDLLWIVGGTLEAEEYVRALLTTQVPLLDPWDQQGMTGDLFVSTPAVPGYTYYDLRRTDALAAMPQMLLRDCFERYYIGYVRPDDAAVEQTALYWAVFRVAETCVDNGFLDKISEHIGSLQGFEKQTVAGEEVRRDANNLFAVREDIVINLSSDDPTALDQYAPFVEAFFAGQLF